MLLASPFIMQYREQRSPLYARRETNARPSSRITSADHNYMLVVERVSRHGSYAHGCHTPELARMQQRKEKSKAK
jgi:hypothetical protein